MATSVRHADNVALDVIKGSDPVRDQTSPKDERDAAVKRESGSANENALRKPSIKNITTPSPLTKPSVVSAGPSILAAPKRNDNEGDMKPIASLAAALSPVSTGPSCNSYSVPPRPKPGRKPAVDKPSEKRKAQNREAQRAFRERKVAHTEELKKDITDLRHVFNEVVAENGSLKRKLQDMEKSQRHLEDQAQERERLVSQLQGEVRRYRQQEEEWSSLKRMHEEMHERIERHEKSLKIYRSDKNSRESEQRQIYGIMPLSGMPPRSPITPPQQSPRQDSSCGNCAQTGYCKCVEDFTVDPTTLPATSSGRSATAGPSTEDGQWTELEQDFTTSAAKSSQPVPAESPTAVPVAHRPGCGFCEDSKDCPCNPHAPAASNAASAPKAPRTVPNPMDISSIVEPGTCVQCQSNPEQRRFCIEVSKNRQLSHEPASNPAKRPRLEDGRPRTLTCSELYQASKHVVAESRRSGRAKAPEIESMFKSFARTHLGAANSASEKGEPRPGMRYRTFSTSEIHSAEALAALHRSSEK